MEVFGRFLYNQLFVTVPYPETDFTNKTIIVTGANAGLGKEAARHFVRLNASKVVLAVRTLRKGEEAKANIEATTGRKGVLEIYQLDLGSYASVKAFAAKVAKLPRVDAVVENAGINVHKFELFEENESTVTVNVVSTMLLAILLLPTLRRSAEKYGTLPTLTIISSEVHEFTSFPERESPSIFATLSNEKEARMFDRYNVSKLMEVFLVRELASRTEASKPDVVINMLNPGLCQSELVKDKKLVAQIFMALLARTGEHGARTHVHAASAGKESHGHFMTNGKVDDNALSALVRSKESPKIQKRVWDELVEKLEAIQPGVTNNI